MPLEPAVILTDGSCGKAATPPRPLPEGANGTSLRAVGVHDRQHEPPLAISRFVNGHIDSRSETESEEWS